MIDNIQHLRAFAAINVVLFHVIGTAATYLKNVSAIAFLGGWGANGVDIFFVISGFIMLHTQMKSEKTAVNFIKSRIIRIVPLYWLATLFIVFLFLMAPSIFRKIDITPLYAFSSLFFVSNIAWSHPIVDVGWTLELEMMFYVIFAVGLLTHSRKSLILFIFLCLLSIAITFSKIILIEFIFGMMLAILLNKVKFTHLTGIYVFSIGLLILISSLFPFVKQFNGDRLIIWGIPAFFIVFGAIYAPQLKSKILSYIGAASYSIYIVQVITISATYKISNKIMPNINSDVLAIFCLLLSVASGCLVYSFVEKPITHLMRRIFYTAPPND